MATKTSVALYKHRTVSVGRTRDIQTLTSPIARSSKAIVFDPSLAHAASRRPTHVGAGACSTTGAAAAAVGAASTACCDAAGASAYKTTMAVTHATTPAAPTIINDEVLACAGAAASRGSTFCVVVASGSCQSTIGIWSDASRFGAAVGAS
jgi:hypothetical protein